MRANIIEKKTVNISSFTTAQLTLFIDLLYKFSSVEKFIYKEQEYSEHTQRSDTEEYVMVDDNNDNNDKIGQCNNDHCKIFPQNQNEVNYVINFINNYEPLTSLTQDDYFASINDDKVKNVMRFILHEHKHGTSLKDIELDCFGCKFTNRTGFNYDRRGSTQCNLDVHYQDKYVLQRMTLYEFLVGMYKIKSHKFDKWYEMFYKIQRKKLSNDNILHITFSFNHGS